MWICRIVISGMRRYKKQWDKMTQVQFLQKEIIRHVEGIKSESRLSWPYMFPAAEPFSVRQGRLHLLSTEEVGGLYCTPPPTKRTSLSYYLMPALFPPGSSLEERREEEEPSTELPRRHHYFKMFKPPFDGLPLMTVTFQEVGCGLIHELCRNWTNTKDGLFLSYWGQL